jgi:hypothetical protein
MVGARSRVVKAGPDRLEFSAFIGRHRLRATSDQMDSFDPIKLIAKTKS